MTVQIVQPLVRYAVADALAERSSRWETLVRSASSAPADGRKAKFDETAREFESLFVAYLFKVMRATIEKSGLFEENAGEDVYTELFDQEVARVIARRGALGISDMLARQFEARWKEDAEVRSPEVPLDADAAGEGNSAAAPESAADIPDFRLPVQAPVSSSYGLRKDPFTRKARFHQGINLAAPAGTSVVAASGGRVVFAGYQKGYGNTVVIEHERGYRTRYAHLGSLAVSAGDSVDTHQLLGTVGSSGRSTGPHLHFEITEYGESIDPRIALAH